MLSKWQFLFLLTLGIQNISAYIGNDMEKFSIFYDPSTRLATKGTLEKTFSSRFPGIGFRGLKCNCDGLTCGCCTGINITRFNFDRSACTNFTFYPDELGVKLKFLINEREIFSSNLFSGKNPPPFCMPFLPFVSFCVRVFDNYVVGKNLHTCIDLQTRVVDWPLLVLHFDCVKIGTDGISWIKPEDSNFSLTSELAVIKPEVNGPEIYDHVDFEPDSVDFPNNHTSNMTPEEENNIGQLKI